MLFTNRFNLFAVDERGSKHYAEMVELDKRKETRAFAVAGKINAGDSVKCRVWLGDAGGLPVKELRAKISVMVGGVWVGEKAVSLKL